MDWVPVHWGSWWYGFAVGCLFTVVYGVTMLVYSVRAIEKSIQEGYPAETGNTEPADPSGPYLCESEQIHPLFR